VIKVARGGAAISSEELAEKISSLGVDGMSDVVIVFDEDYKRTRVDYSLEISQMDLHKDLMLVILYEQIYRAYRIINKEPYHK
jgi:23S rRNA (pseudouridine1915-N3)-methyltransferase